MHKILLFLIALLLGNVSFSQPLDETLLSKMNEGKIPGAAFVVVKDGKLIYQNNLGFANITNNKPVDDLTIFMLASVSKTMIATAVMQLWEKGLIDLDADINQYLSFSVRSPSFPDEPITARMLLTHTSAIRDEWNTMASLYVYGDSPVALDSFMKNYFSPNGLYYNAGNFYFYQPGTAYNYSNVGSTLAAYLVETITGDQFSNYCDTAIFQKLCMEHTSFLLDGISDTTKIARPYTWYNGDYEDAGLYGYPDYPDGQLRSTSTDMARFMTMYMQYGIYEGTRILDSTTVDYMLSQQTSLIPNQGIIFYSANASNGHILWGHNGGDIGANTAMYFNMNNKTGMVVLTNGDGTSNANADLFANELYLYGLTASPGINDTFPACGSNTGITKTDWMQTFKIYPNPANTEVFVDMPIEGTASIFDLQGRLIYNTILKPSITRITVKDFCNAGLYLVHISDKNNNTIVRKLAVH